MSIVIPDCLLLDRCPPGNACSCQADDGYHAGTLKMLAPLTEGYCPKCRVELIAEEGEGLGGRCERCNSRWRAWNPDGDGDRLNIERTRLGWSDEEVVERAKELELIEALRSG